MAALPTRADRSAQAGPRAERLVNRYPLVDPYYEGGHLRADLLPDGSVRTEWINVKVRGLDYYINDIRVVSAETFRELTGVDLVLDSSWTAERAGKPVQPHKPD